MMQELTLNNLVRRMKGKPQIGAAEQRLMAGIENRVHSLEASKLDLFHAIKQRQAAIESGFFSLRIFDTIANRVVVEFGKEPAALSGGASRFVVGVQPAEIKYKKSKLGQFRHEVPEIDAVTEVLRDIIQDLDMGVSSVAGVQARLTSALKDADKVEDNLRAVRAGAYPADASDVLSAKLELFSAALDKVFGIDGQEAFKLQAGALPQVFSASSAKGVADNKRYGRILPAGPQRPVVFVKDASGREVVKETVEFNPKNSLALR